MLVGMPSISMFSLRVYWDRSFKHFLLSYNLSYISLFCLLRSFKRLTSFLSVMFFFCLSLRFEAVERFSVTQVYSLNSFCLLPDADFSTVKDHTLVPISYRTFVIQTLVLSII